jgi:hypothetical protein
LIAGPERVSRRPRHVVAMSHGNERFRSAQSATKARRCSLCMTNADSLSVRAALWLLPQAIIGPHKACFAKSRAIF